MQMVMNQLMNNRNFSNLHNMHIEMRDAPGFRYRYRNTSPRSQPPPALQGPPGRHSCVSSCSACAHEESATGHEEVCGYSDWCRKEAELDSSH